MKVIDARLDEIGMSARKLQTELVPRGPKAFMLRRFRPQKGRKLPSASLRTVAAVAAFLDIPFDEIIQWKRS